MWHTRDNCSDIQMTLKTNLCATWSSGTTVPHNRWSPQLFRNTPLYAFAVLCVCKCKQTGSYIFMSKALPLCKSRSLHIDYFPLCLYSAQHREDISNLLSHGSTFTTLEIRIYLCLVFVLARWSLHSEVWHSELPCVSTAHSPAVYTDN